MSISADRIPRGEPGSVCPSWVYDGWYANNPDAQKTAIARWAIPVTTAEERQGAKEFLVPQTTFSCTNCGQFAFAQPTICFWCRHA